MSRLRVAAKSEANAINAIQSYYSVCQNVNTTEISINDKEPSLDGKISIHDLGSDRQYTKENKICDIAVQVKGRSGGLSKRNTFAISYRDILYFWKHTEGVIYFCVSLKKKQPEIYYAKLTPIILQSLIKQKNKNAKSKAIVFDSVPEDPTEFTSVLLDFNTQCQKQPKSLLALSKPDISNVKLFTSINAKPEHRFSILKSGITLYRQITDQLTGEPISVPYDFGRVVDVFNISKGTITTSDNLTSTAALSVSKTTNDQQLIMGSHDNISFKEIRDTDALTSSVTLNFTPHGNYRERLDDVNFLLSMLTDLESIKEIDLQESKKYKNDLNKQIEYLTGIIRDLSGLGIKIDFDPDNLAVEETKTLNDLLDVLHEKLVPKPDFQRIHLKLFDDRYAFIVYKQTIMNLFSTAFLDKYCLMENDDDAHTRLNPFTYLRKALFKYPGFSNELVLSGFEKMDITSANTANYYVGYVLNLIQNFDDSQDDKFLELGLEILNMVKPSVDPGIITIDICQILMRQNKDIGINNISRLLEATNSTNQEIQISAFILLNQKKEVINIWENLNIEEKNKILSWPIVTLSPVTLEI